jgi:hypothetical protein
MAVFDRLARTLQDCKWQMSCGVASTPRDKVARELAVFVLTLIEIKLLLGINLLTSAFQPF